MKKALTENMVNTAGKIRKGVYDVPDMDRQISYDLFIPDCMDPEKKYPLVLFVHDLSAGSEISCAPQDEIQEAQNWLGESVQKRQKCFVLAPRYRDHTDGRREDSEWLAEATMKLIRTLLDDCNIDESRIYGAGQELGCRILCELGMRYPDFIGGYFMAGGQCDPQQMIRMKESNIWILVSAGDETSFSAMQECMAQAERAGGHVTRGSINGSAPAEIQNAQVRHIAGSGGNLFFTWFEEEPAVPEGVRKDALTTDSRCETAWKKSYGITAIRDWLFTRSSRKIDFSCKHNIMIRNEDATLCPMDEPYFRAKVIMPGTWQIESSGDYSYLAEGEEQAVLIDTGYGCGNIRSFAQSLTEKPVKYAVNTHDHFDHTANNGYFDGVYMSAETAELATIPFPSFDGIEFPADYQRIIVDDGDVISLGGRDLLVFKMPDHAAGSILLLDSRDGILFCGDEMTMPFGKPMNGPVERFRGHLKRLQEHREKIQLLCGGPGIADAGLIDRLSENMDHILKGNEGQPMLPETENSEECRENSAWVIYDRRMPHEPDRHRDDPADMIYKRKMDYAGTCVIYDIRKVYDDRESDV